MNTQLTNEDYKAILELIRRAQLTGAEATHVAILQQKIGANITVEQEIKKDGTEGETTS